MVIGKQSVVRREILRVEMDPAVTLGLILNFVFQVSDAFINTSNTVCD